MMPESATRSIMSSPSLAGSIKEREFLEQIFEVRVPDTGTERVVDAVSVDLEDYYQVEAFASGISRSQWGRFPSRIRENTKRALDVLNEANCRATFFVLGWIAQREPALVRALAEAGHELACHSHLHRPLHTLKPSEFRADLVRSRKAIEDAAGVQVLGFRAPTFSITKRTPWALEILAEEGFQYDSSIFPIRHDLYGVPDAPRWAHRRRLSSGCTIWEIPPSTVRVGKMNVPFGGGGYLRLLPMLFTRWAIHRTHSHEHRPIVVYFHPWELDPEQPRLSGSWKSRLRHYTNLSKTGNRLRRILSRGCFEPMIALVRRLEARSEHVVDSLQEVAVPFFGGPSPETALAVPATSAAVNVSQ